MKFSGGFLHVWLVVVLERQIEEDWKCIFGISTSAISNSTRTFSKPYSNIMWHWIAHNV